MKAKRRKEASELETILKHFLPPGLSIDPVTRQVVELSAKMAAEADFRHQRRASPPDHNHPVYNFLSRIKYSRTINNLRCAEGGSCHAKHDPVLRS